MKRGQRLFKGWLKGWTLNDAERAEVEAFLSKHDEVLDFQAARSGRTCKRPRGRPRVYADKKAKQRAWRQRKKGIALRKYTRLPDVPTASKPA